MTLPRSARGRLTVASFLGLLIALAALVVVVNARYRDGLEDGLRDDLDSGAVALRAARTPAEFKDAIDSLAAEGISVDITGTTAPGGTLRAEGDEDLLTVHETMRLGGRPVVATLAASRAAIDRQVHSLEVTQAIGGAIALALLAALAAVLILLARAGAEARASEAAMRTFLADASHELRTPVAALQASAERLLREQPARPARDAIEAQLVRDSRRLGKLIDDLLGLARLEARGSPQLERERVDLAEVAAAAVAAARARDPDGVIEVAGEPVAVEGDREALLRAIGNMLDNALAVADTVAVAVSPTGDGATVTVTDDGPGVPAEERARIFEPFARLPGSPPGGTGLGLSIVRRTAAAHDGKVGCEAGRDGGARFTLWLPAAPA